jgi:DNA (cytosine-5-)-methyltransferase
MREAVGGQALIEGVMMRCGKKKAIAIRKPNGEIFTKKLKPYILFENSVIYQIPFIRGIFILINSMIEGSKDLTYSASFFMEDEENSKLEQWLEKFFGKNTQKIVDGAIFIFSFLFAMFLFVFLPTMIARNQLQHTWFISLKEGIVKILLFIAYLFLVSRTKDIHRVFEYHGAEHKSVFCYEQGKPLTVENVRKMSRFHPRCGTNFIFLILIVSVLVFSFVNVRVVLVRSVIKLALFPVVSGISYEILKIAGCRDFFAIKLFVYPGMLLQHITTQEPDDSQIEVAISALLAAVEES